MERPVKESCCNKRDNGHVPMPYDAGGVIKVITEAKSDFAVKVRGLFSPPQNALYYINCGKLYTMKVLSAGSCNLDKWEQQCKVAGKTQ